MGRFGTWEIVIIALIALVIFGGRRLPELGRGLGKGIANFRESLKGLGGDCSAGSEGLEVKPAPAASSAEGKASLMFGVGWTEIMAIVVIGLLVLGPDDLPKVARQVGRGYQWLRQTTTEARSLLAKDFNIGQEVFSEALNDISEAPREIKSTVNTLVAGASRIQTNSANDREAINDEGK